MLIEAQVLAAITGEHGARDTLGYRAEAVGQGVGDVGSIQGLLPFWAMQSRERRVARLLEPLVAHDEVTRHVHHALVLFHLRSLCKQTSGQEDGALVVVGRAVALLQTVSELRFDDVGQLGHVVGRAGVPDCFPSRVMVHVVNLLW